MLPEIEHRGPDGIGIWQDGRVAFGHTRLAVIDLSEASAQPMLTADQTGAIVYNGEIYNYRELRRDLERQGVSFRSSGDTEVLLNALHHWGPKNCLDRLNGMFAFAYLDRREGALWLARDKVGIKPLIVADTGVEFIFASEAKALLAHPRMRRRVDRHEMVKWLLSGGMGPRQILFAGMDEVEPGSVLKITPGAVERTRYFDLVGSISAERLTANSSVSLDAWPNEFRGRLKESVTLHLESDAPVAVMCSGGVDSSLIAAYAKDQLPGLQAYVADVSWPNAEGDQAARVCQHLGIPLRRIVVDQSCFLRLWPHAVWHSEASPLRPSAVAVLAVARACHADGIKVLLNGEGSDELFGGYGWHQSVYGRWRTRSSQKAFLRAPFNLPWSSEQISSRWMIALDADPVLMPRRLMEHLGTIEPPSDRAFLARGLFDLRYHLPWILHRLDRLGMAASIETRVPFLENGLFDLAFHLPARAKLQQRHGKWLVKQAAAQRLPADVVFARKKGFPVPLAFSSGTERLIADGMLADFMQWPAETTREIVATLSNQPGLRFQLVGLEQWFRMFFDGQSPELLAEKLNGLAHEAKPRSLKTSRSRKVDGQAPEALAEKRIGLKRHTRVAPISSGWFGLYNLGRFLGPLRRNIRLNIRVFVYGKVQNAGFQNWLAKRAKETGLVGWVRNRSDGSAEAVFEGKYHAIEELLAQCRAGPTVSELIVQSRRARCKRQDFWRRKSVKAPGARTVQKTAV
jgi:asparagine synthase (glutamine-hydrolysing)